MAITHVGTASGANGSGTPVSTAQTIAVTAGDLIVVNSLVWANAKTHVVTDNASGGTNTYNAAVGPYGTGSDIRQWWAIAKASETLTFSLAAATAGATTIFASVFNPGAGKVWKAAPRDKYIGSTQVDVGSGDNEVTSGVTATRSQAEEILVGGLVDESGDTDFTPGTGIVWIMPTNGKLITGSVYQAGAVEYFIASSTGTDAATFTHFVTTSTGTVIGTYMNEAAGGKATKNTRSFPRGTNLGAFRGMGRKR